MWYLWVLISLACFIVELFTPSFFFFCIGIGFLNALIPALLKLSLGFQILFAVIGWVLAFVFLRPVLLKTMKTKKTNVDALIGKKGIVTYDISALNKGRVKVGSESWLASSTDSIPKDRMVVIRAVEGVTLIVEEDK